VWFVRFQGFGTPAVSLLSVGHSPTSKKKLTDPNSHIHNSYTEHNPNGTKKETIKLKSNKTKNKAITKEDFNQEVLFFSSGSIKPRQHARKN
jgi:hypothetical protein